MSDSPSGEFSFDLYPGLDADLQAALARNVQKGSASPEAVDSAGIAAAVEDALSQVEEDESSNLSEAVSAWVSSELESASDGACRSWEKYGSTLGLVVPGSVEELLAQSPNLAPKLARLYEAKLALVNSSEVTPGDEKIGETMHLVLLPWQAMRNNLDDIESFMTAMRNAQGVSPDGTGFNITVAIAEKKTFYKVWENPRTTYTAESYLDYRIDNDGPWGVALIQTSNEPGVKSLVGKSPDGLTDDQTHGLTIDGQEVGSMGIFEWWALTLQEDPRNLSSEDYTWMLANRLNVNGVSRVPFGSWAGDRVSSALDISSVQATVVRPRLAVI